MPQDLLSHACLRIADVPWLLEGPSGAVKPAVLGPVTANNLGLLHRLALRDGGIVALPVTLAAPDITQGALVAVLPQWRPATVSVYALSSTKLLPAKVRIFLDFLAGRLNAVAR